MNVGEIRRVLNSFLQMIEHDRSHSLVIAATNHADLLDPALFRRFDDVLHYDLPGQEHIVRLLEMRLSGHTSKQTRWAALADGAAGLSHAEITRAAHEALKDALIRQRAHVEEADIRRTIEERKTIACRLHDPKRP